MASRTRRVRVQLDFVVEYDRDLPSTTFGAKELDMLLDLMTKWLQKGKQNPRPLSILPGFKLDSRLDFRRTHADKKDHA